MNNHPLAKYNSEDKTPFDMNRFYWDVLMSLAVAATVFALKKWWMKFTDMEK